VAESGVPGYEATAWSMLMGPAKLPRAVVMRIHSDTARFLDNSEVRNRLAREGAEPSGASPEKSAQFLRAEIERWAGVIKGAGVKVDN
jgi:tripartite-type tricarboxylate transporter receptor subunit TctC